GEAAYRLCSWINIFLCQDSNGVYLIISPYFYFIILNPGKANPNNQKTAPQNAGQVFKATL
ncbi:MAG: hypothetical protein Q8L57_01675, partial [bacterium]|nr:hypothetical protein [bacterium]